jgi:hypothetical protein
MRPRKRVFKAFEQWGPVGFIVGGLGLIGTTVVGSLDVAGLVQSPPRLAMGPLLFGLWFVFVGLVGLYSPVRDGAPRLSLGGVWTAGIAWIVWTGTLLAALVVDLTSGRTFADPGSWGPPLLAVGFVLALLSFLAYGLGSTRAEHPFRNLGLLLLVPVVAFLGQAVLLLSKIVTGDVLAVLQLVFGGVIGLVLILVGYRLRFSAEGPLTTEAQADATA